ncbi:MAG: adenylate/guanylate cyclase domain-containing protein [Bacteroidales bacterium]
MKTVQNDTIRQQATILYAATSGFDDLSNILQPEKITQLMNQCYGSIDKVVSLYGGYIEKFSGDGILVAFGVPDFHDKTPLNAINAAFDLHNKMDELNDQNELPCLVSIKSGIQTGSVLIGKIGTGDKIQNSVMGETVTLASRICDIAENGQVLADQDTYDRTKDKFEFQVMEPVPVKGRKKPMPVFEVKGRKKAPISIGLQPGRMINSSMVGRELEYKLLEKQFMQLINGRGSVVEIIGKAGLGKSRLMAELKESDIVKKVAFFEGRAISNGQNLSFHPIIQIIKSWAGIKEEDNSEESIEKLQKNIQRVYPEAFDEIFPFIATMMGYRLDGKSKERLKGIEGEALENLILKNLRDLLSRAASIRPVVIAIEDAHWCDVSSIIFLESLLKLVRKQRIMFVLIFRPGYKETGERISKYLAENLQDYQLSINVEPLTPEQSDELIKNLLHEISLPEAINKLIIERAAGNPFFIEEVIRSFLDEGLITINNNQFILSENINYANIPESIDHVILSRIERLDGKTKELLKTASVIGRNFYFKILEEAAQTIEELDSKLEYLKDIQLLNERKQKNEVEYLFKHALAQQAAYDSIVEKTRKELHLRIAGSIEKVFADRIHEFYGTLSHHYSKAGQQDKTEEYLVKAGEESMKSGASSEAVNFLKQALETHLQNNKNTPDRQKVVDLEEKLAFALYASGQFTEAVEYFEKVICFYHKSFPVTELQRKLSFPYSLCVMVWIIYVHRPNRDRKGADIEKKILTMMDRKNRALISADPKRMFFDVLYAFRFLGRHKFESYDAAMVLSACPMFVYTGIKVLYRLGRKGIETSLKYIDDQDAFDFTNSKYALCAYAYYTGGKFDPTDEKKVFNQGIRIGEPWPLTVYFFYGGYSIIESGNKALSQHFVQRLKGLAEVIENSYTLVQSIRLNAFYCLKYREIEHVLKITENAIGLAIKSNHIMTIIESYCLRSIVCSLESNFDEAISNLSEVEKYLKGITLPLFLTRYLIAKCFIEIAEFKSQKNSNGNEMIKTTKQLIKQAKRNSKNLTEAYHLRAVVFWLLNKPTRAYKNFEKSINAGKIYDCNLELSRTYFEAGKFLRDTSNKKERINGMNGTECLMKAKSMFEELNLHWDLNEYHKYMNS